MRGRGRRERNSGVGLIKGFPGGGLTPPRFTGCGSRDTSRASSSIEPRMHRSFLDRKSSDPWEPRRAWSRRAASWDSTGVGDPAPRVPLGDPIQRHPRASNSRGEGLGAPPRRAHRAGVPRASRRIGPPERITETDRRDRSLRPVGGTRASPDALDPIGGDRVRPRGFSVSSEDTAILEEFHLDSGPCLHHGRESSKG